MKSKESEEMDVSNIDLSNEDFNEYKKINFEFQKKESRVNMRIPDQLLARIKQKAKLKGMPYTRYIREVLEKSLG